MTRTAKKTGSILDLHFLMESILKEAKGLAFDVAHFLLDVRVALVTLCLSNHNIRREPMLKITDGY